MMRGKLTCVECGKNSTYKVTKKAERCSHDFVHPEQVHSDDKRRVNSKLCGGCFKKELKQLLFDEVGGILGNLEYHGPNTLVDLAKALVKHGYTEYYKASEYLVFQALKDNQDPDGMFGPILMMPDGDKSTLNKKFRG